MSFDALAPYYRVMEAVLAGPLLQQQRTRFLHRTRDARQALLLGEGPGRFLVELLRVNPEVRITCLDRSARMLEQAAAGLRRAGADDSRVHYVNRDARSWTPPTGAFDLVATCFFLDCFPAPALKDLIARVARATTGSAQWLVADFHLPSKGWQRTRSRVILAAMYAFFRRTTNLPASHLVPPDPYLQDAGFRLLDRHLGNWGLLRSEVWRREAP